MLEWLLKAESIKCTALESETYNVTNAVKNITTKEEHEGILCLSMCSIDRDEYGIIKSMGIVNWHKPDLKSYTEFRYAAYRAITIENKDNGSVIIKNYDGQKVQDYEKN